ncbi:unnamed protein product [Euphydryas editha]|uniref:Endonuclease/exonuclease/phosphatase domain-containing protein n=1 Tax=Euphydryas editha TaxID=104508 RepID=A0AAU9UAH4_EUPED|nr:unnamed protein product [Euphydryas editha]
MGDTELRVFAGYRPPGQDFHPEDLQCIFVQQRPTIMVGDLNAKHPTWGSNTMTPVGRKLYEDAELNGYVVVGPSSPTHIPSDPRCRPDVLDIVVHSGLPSPVNVEVIYDLDTQHLPLLVTVDLQDSIRVQKGPRRRIDWSHYAAHLKQFELPLPIRTVQEVEEATQVISNHIKMAMEEASIPINITTAQRNPLPGPLRAMLRRKRDLRKLWARTRCPRVKRDLNRLAEELSFKLGAFRGSEWETNIDRADDSDLSLYRLCRQLSRALPPVHPLFNERGERCYAAKDRAEILGTYLEGQFIPNPLVSTTTNAVSEHHVKVENSVREFLTSSVPRLEGRYYISPSETQKVAMRLSKGKAPGPDGIPSMAIRGMPWKCLVALTRLFNGILRTGHFPEAWKLGKTINMEEQDGGFIKTKELNPPRWFTTDVQ